LELGRYFTGCQPALTQRSCIDGAVIAATKARAAAGSALLVGIAAE
jgi:hypothetical protein